MYFGLNSLLRHSKIPAFQRGLLRFVSLVRDLSSDSDWWMFLVRVACIALGNSCRCKPTANNLLEPHAWIGRVAQLCEDLSGYVVRHGLSLSGVLVSPGR